MTADEVDNPQGLALWTTVNGERRQSGNTKHMVFPARRLVAYVSRFMSLQVGDLISTGTPAGVGHGARAKVAPISDAGPDSIGKVGLHEIGLLFHECWRMLLPSDGETSLSSEAS